MKTISATTILVVLLAALTAWTYKLHGSPTVGVDDANIFFSYSENLAAGNGITYAQNAERVEGFTSVLWMLLCALMFWLGFNEAGVFALCFVSLVATQVLLLRAIHTCTLQKDRHAWAYQAIYVTLILFSPGYITWMTITLMDTCLWGLIVAGMTYCLVSPPRSHVTAFFAAVPFALAPATRPESLLVAPIFLALLWLRSRSTGFNYATKYCLFIGLSFFSTTILLTVFRMHYFGYPFPNTYYAKVSPSLVYNLREGKDYLYRFVLSGPIVGLALAFLLFCCASWLGHTLDRICSNKSLRPMFNHQIMASVAISFAGLTLLLVPVLTGGDHFAMFRFFQPSYPLMCLAPILFLAEWSPYPALEALRHHHLGWRSPGKNLAVGLVLAFWLFAYSSECSWYSMRWGSPLAADFRIAEGGITDGRTITALFSETGQLPSVGVTAAGGIARTYRGPVIDLMGLNNKMIAHYNGDRKGLWGHAAFETDAFFQIVPDIVLASPPVPPKTVNFSTMVLKGLLEDPRFVSGWRYGRLSATNERHELTAFIRTQFLESLGEATQLRFHDTMIWSNKWVEATVLPDGNTEPHP